MAVVVACLFGVLLTAMANAAFLGPMSPSSILPVPISGGIELLDTIVAIHPKGFLNALVHKEFLPNFLETRNGVPVLEVQRPDDEPRRRYLTYIVLTKTFIGSIRAHNTKTAEVLSRHDDGFVYREMQEVTGFPYIQGLSLETTWHVQEVPSDNGFRSRIRVSTKVALIKEVSFVGGKIKSAIAQGAAAEARAMSQAVVDFCTAAPAVPDVLPVS
ncbi:unnamed protein product [Phaeothamnion confervicola]